ncbi:MULTISPECIES: hypothetical protein [Photorhabdus]|uniref:hypothetical protein n=1 Tax=Photorhabdus TaxID=29487 RepID=UPI0002E0F5FE|nr:hypothetical protein [Photorhabdus asymbiotica]
MDNNSLANVLAAAEGSILALPFLSGVAVITSPIGTGDNTGIQYLAMVVLILMMLFLRIELVH